MVTGYKLLDVAGRGGMSTVYRAIQEETGREVALKVIRGGRQEQLDQFSREGEIIASLEHPHILPVYHFGSSGDQPYLVMRLLDGGSLADWVVDGGVEDQDKVFEVITNIAEALDFSHARGVLHRDVKPSNMLLDQSGFVYLSDFGIAMFPSDGERRGLGSAAYISPEQARGEALDGRADIYSLSVSLFELLTGQKPYVGKTPVAVMVKQINDPVPDPREINPNISRSVAELIRLGMSKKPDNRPQSAGQFGQLLSFARRNPDASVRPSTSGVTIPFHTITPPKGMSTIRVTPEDEKVISKQEEQAARSNRWLVIISASFLLLFAIATVLVLWVLVQNPELILPNQPTQPIIQTQAPEDQPTFTIPIDSPVDEALVFEDSFEDESNPADCADGICFADGFLQISTADQSLTLWPVDLGPTLRNGLMQVELVPSSRSASYQVGLVCRLFQTEQGAGFIGMQIEKNGDMQTATAFRFVNGEREILDSELIDPESGLLLPEDEPAKLELSCFDGDLEFSINGLKVLASRDESISAGAFGVITANTADSNHQIRVDNLKIFDSVPEEAESE